MRKQSVLVENIKSIINKVSPKRTTKISFDFTIYEILEIGNRKTEKEDGEKQEGNVRDER